MTQTTPTPRYERKDDLICEDGKMIGVSGRGHEAKIDALLSTANSQAGLVEALTEAEKLIAKNTYPQPDKPDSQWGILQRVRAALAAAVPKGGENG